MENREKATSVESELRGMKLSDFKHLEDSTISEWIDPQEEMPEDFWEKFKNVSADTHLFEIVSAIDRELYVPKNRDDHGAQSFADSRFTPLAEMLERNMVSCGAKAKIFSEVLRRFGIPVQLVHLNPDDPHHPAHRHAWIRIYDPTAGVWLTIDPTRTRTGYAPEEEKYREIRTYHSWTELKPDFDRGDY